MRNAFVLLLLGIMLSACAGSGGGQSAPMSGNGVTGQPSNQPAQNQWAPSCRSLNSCANFCWNLFHDLNNPNFSQCINAPADRVPFAGYTYVPGAN